MTIPAQMLVEDAVQRATGVGVSIRASPDQLYAPTLELFPDSMGPLVVVPLREEDLQGDPRVIAEAMTRRVEVKLAQHLAETLE